MKREREAMPNLLDQLTAAHFEIVKLFHDKWEWVAEIRKDNLVGKATHPKKQKALDLAYRAWKVQKALQTIPGEPPTLGAKVTETLRMKDEVS
ncbi:MAG: hypothetical protein WC977_09905 [Anaerovoracaceae bacterium]|jgi:hypothetical protein